MVSSGGIILYFLSYYFLCCWQHVSLSALSLCLREVSLPSLFPRPFHACFQGLRRICLWSIWDLPCDDVSDRFICSDLYQGFDYLCCKSRKGRNRLSSPSISYRNTLTIVCILASMLKGTPLPFTTTLLLQHPFSWRKLLFLSHSSPSLLRAYPSPVFFVASWSTLNFPRLHCLWKHEFSRCRVKLTKLCYLRLFCGCLCTFS